MENIWDQAIDWARNHNDQWEVVARELNRSAELGYRETGENVNLDVLKHAIASAAETLEKGEGQARVIGAANEIYAAYRGRDGSNEHLKDLINNEVGFAVADFLEDHLDRPATVEDILAVMPVVANAGLLAELANGDKGQQGLGQAFWATFKWEFLGQGNWVRGYIDRSLEFEKEEILSRISDNSTDCFLPGTMISVYGGGKKPIEKIEVGDVIVSYDRVGSLRPGRVTRTFVKEVEHVLDFFGTGITPGHVTLCGEGKFAGQHVPIIDILRTDGAIVRKDGTLVRAATGCALGSEGDKFISVITGIQLSDGRFKVKETGRLRLGTRVLSDAGVDVSILDLIELNGGKVTDEGMILRTRSDAPMPFVWTFGPSLPKPEDYVLSRSGFTLEDIYDANEWESNGTRLPHPDAPAHSI